MGTSFAARKLLVASFWLLLLQVVIMPIHEDRMMTSCNRSSQKLAPQSCCNFVPLSIFALGLEQLGILHPQLVLKVHLKGPVEEAR